jgi:hypothetical protein
MADKVVIEAEVKSNVKEVGKDAKSTAGEFKVMGVSLNGVKAAFASAGKTAKLMFGSIKAGLISTGIGAFVVLIGSLLVFLTKTKKGAELLQTAFAGIGAAVAVLTDRISAIGGAVVKIFSGDFMGAVKDVKGAMVGIGDEIARETRLAIELEQTFQRIADAERGLNLERAEANKVIMKARLDAEDETKSLEERISSLQKANAEELKITAKSLAIQQEKVLATEAEVGLGESMADDLDRLNQEKIKLLDMETASFSMQKRLTTGIETLRTEAATKQKAREKERQDAIKAQAKLVEDKLKAEQKQLQELIDLEQDRVNKLTVDAATLLDKFNASQLEAIDKEKNAIYDKYFAIIEGKRALGESVVELEEAEKSEIFAIEEKFRKKNDQAEKAAGKKQEAIDDGVRKHKIDTVKMGFEAASMFAEEGSAAAKGIAVAQTIFNTQQAIMKAMADVPFPMNIAQSVLAGAMGAQSIATIMSTDPSGAGGGTGGGGGGAVAATPAPQMMSGQFELGAGIEPEATRAFVVTDDMTNSQNQLANIRRRATI